MPKSYFQEHQEQDNDAPSLTQSFQNAAKLQSQQWLNQLNATINQDGLVTNKTGLDVLCLIQNDDKTFAIEALKNSETKGVEAILFDSNGDGTPDTAARVFNGAGLDAAFNLILDDANCPQLESPSWAQGVINNSLESAGGHGKPYLDFLPMEDFMNEFKNLQDTITDSYPEQCPVEPSNPEPPLIKIGM